MVDFTKRLGKKASQRPLEPQAIYDSLDRASDKGPLRPAQAYILSEWHQHRRDARDVIVKLHTGQGKTLIGLLILQSKLNEGKGPAVYLCPTRQLVAQTCEQAKQFGVAFSEVEPDLPIDFIEGRSILITTAKKLFNGATRFGLGPKSLPVGAVLMDDSHACVDAIRDSVSITLERDNPIYARLVELFGDELTAQGAGTLEDISNKNHEALLPVPYWAWHDRSSEVTKILGAAATSDALKFVWPILRDRISDCACYISGTTLQIVPHLAPLDVFGSYWAAKHRVFMSATVADDSFLVKGLRLGKETILKPLSYPNEKWSGEKMILLPSLIHDEINRSEVVAAYAPKVQGRPHGLVVLTPSFKRGVDWEGYGAMVARPTTIDDLITWLKQGRWESAIVLANRYDGIDLADDQCRILIFDSLPHSDDLQDRYFESCRPGSDLTRIRLARSIEQGLGRSVRGEKDYSVIIVIGDELVKFLRYSATRAFLSDQTRKQIEIGLEAAEMAQEGAASEERPITALHKLVQQCIRRDQGWKDFYVQEMNTLAPSAPVAKGLDVFELELQAETLYQNNDPDGAAAVLQSIIDKHCKEDSERGFYLQEIARCWYKSSKVKSDQFQLLAHRKNRYLLRPKQGSLVQTLEPLPGQRINNIITWVRQFENYETLKVSVDALLSDLQFGTDADPFEHALQELGLALGFASERPDKEWKAGPDNLWCVGAGDYILIEAKSRVLEDRSEIYKDESGQMNNACGWFRSFYPGAAFTRLIVIPTNKLGHGAFFNEEVGVVRKQELKKLRNSIRGFFGEFRSHDFGSLDPAVVNSWLSTYALTVDNLKADYQKASFSGTAK